MIINNSSPEHHLLRKIYRHVDFSFIHEMVIRRMEPLPSSDNLSLLGRLGSVPRCSEALLYWGTGPFIMTDEEILTFIQAIREIIENIDEWKKDYVYDSASNDYFYIHHLREDMSPFFRFE